MEEVEIVFVDGAIELSGRLFLVYNINKTYNRYSFVRVETQVRITSFLIETRGKNCRENLLNFDLPHWQKCHAASLKDAPPAPSQTGYRIDTPECEQMATEVDTMR